MPIRRGTVSFARFRLAGPIPRDSRRWLTAALKAGAFTPVDPRGDEDRAAGFVELESQEASGFAPGALFQGTSALFAWRVDLLRAPGAQLRAELQRWSLAFEASHGRPPGRREKTEQKDALRKAWRSKADPVTRCFDVSLALRERELLVWATSGRVVDEVQAALEEHLEVTLRRAIPAAVVPASKLDALVPTPALFGQGA
jgi:hypothetical protein